MGIWLEEEIVQKTVEKILFRVAGVTKYKKAVKESQNMQSTIAIYQLRNLEKNLKNMV